jgi:hypothetical protein
MNDTIKLALDGKSLYEYTGRIEDIDRCILHRSVLARMLSISQPIAYVHPDELEELSHCNGMSIWAENALAHTEDSLTKQLLPAGYVPIYSGERK